MKNAGLYLLDSNKQEYYFINISLIQSQYKVCIQIIPLPTSLPSGWSYPSNKGFTLPFSTEYPNITIPNNGVVDLLGIPAGTYPQTTSGGDSYILSTNIPQISPIQCLLFRCNLCNNPFSADPSVIYATTNNDALFGSLIPCTIYSPQFNSITDGFYQSLEISINDQNLCDVTILDPDIVIMVQIKQN